MMTWRLYIIPVTRLDKGEGREFVAPKYFFGRLTSGLPGMEGVTWAWERYVWENRGIIAADTTDTQHDLLTAQEDVIAVPALDNVITSTAVRDRVRNYLEAGNIPGSWVNTGITYRQIIRTVLNVWRFANRYMSKGGRISAAGVSLDTTWASIPEAARQRLRDTADEFGLDYSSVTASTTVRQLLKGLADQFGDLEYRLGDMVI